MNNRWHKQEKLIANQIVKNLDLYFFVTTAGYNSYSEKYVDSCLQDLTNLYADIVRIVPESKRSQIEKRTFHYYYDYRSFDKVKWLSTLCESVFGIELWEEFG